MKKLALGLISAVLISLSGLAMAAEQYVAGKDYTVLSKVGKVDIPGKIEVREFFWYGCGHCYKLEPFMQTWLKQLPKDVNFVRTPAAMNPVWEQNARGYYVSEALGIRKKTHIALFDAIHRNGQQIFDQASLAQFYSRYGANVSQFNSLYHSFAITGKVNQANNLAQYYQLTGVPAVVVNGKYVIQGEDQHVIEVLNYLLQKERASLKKAS
jgi:thiol:disulfide interchange protein DsbA